MSTQVLLAGVEPEADLIALVTIPDGSALAAFTVDSGLAPFTERVRAEIDRFKTLPTDLSTKAGRKTIASMRGDDDSGAKRTCAARGADQMDKCAGGGGPLRHQCPDGVEDAEVLGRSAVGLSATGSVTLWRGTRHSRTIRL